MNAITTLIIALSMSVDAFAATLSKGAVLQRPQLTEALRTGVIEAITPMVGWSLGIAASVWIKEIDHWVAFVLLGFVGGRMALHGLTREDDAPAETKHSFALLAVTAFATSLDAMAVGVTLAFMQVDILTMAAAIGAATFLMAAIGTLAGRWVGPVLGRTAETVGGLCLIAIGVKILIEHTLGG